MLSESSLAVLVLLGLFAFFGGILLMYYHKAEIDRVFKSKADNRVRRFELRKYWRRTAASTIIASMGILMCSTYWAHEPSLFIGLISIVLTLLLALMFIAFLDMMSVGLHTVTQEDSARKEMIEEYLRQRKKLVENSEPIGDTDEH